MRSLVLLFSLSPFTLAIPQQASGHQIEVPVLPGTINGAEVHPVTSSPGGPSTPTRAPTPPIPGPVTPGHDIICNNPPRVFAPMNLYDCTWIITRLRTDALPLAATPPWGYAPPPLISLAHRVPRRDMQGTCRLDITLSGRLAVREKFGPSVQRLKHLLTELKDTCRSKGGVVEWGRLRFRLSNSGNLSFGVEGAGLNGDVGQGMNGTMEGVVIAENGSVIAER